MTTISSLEQLESVYGQPGEASLAKVTRTLIPEYRDFIEASSFAVLATSGPEGLDCSPRGDRAGFVRVVDEKTLHIPDRRGNNRVDSLRNIVRDPRVAMLFLLPGSVTTMRLNGRAEISIDPALIDSYIVENKPPRSVLVITVNEVYFQCGRAIVRSDLWNPARFLDPESLPTPGQVLSKLSQGRIDGEDYDVNWPERSRQTLW